MKRYATLACCLLLLPGLLADEKKPEAKKTAESKKAEAKKPKQQVAFVGGHVLTGDGRSFDPGVLLVEDGKITKIGAQHDLPVPKGHQQIDARGYWLCPGMIVVKPTRVALTGRGKYDEQFDRYHPEAELLHALGITAFYAGGGYSSGKLDKNNAVIRLVRDTKDDKVLLMQPACATLDYARARSTQRAQVKKLFEQAKKHIEQLEQYHAKLEQWKKDLDAWKKREATREAEAKKAAEQAAKKKEEEKKAPDKNKKEEPKKKPEAKKDPRPEAPVKPKANAQIQMAAEVLQHKLPLRLPGSRQGELQRIVELARELKIRPIVDGAVEGWTLTGELASVGTRVVINPRERAEPRYPGDRRSGWTIENAFRLDRGGVRVTLCPGGTGFGYWGVTGDDLLTFRLIPAFAVRGGLSNDKALAGVTAEAARLLGVADQIGTLQQGRYADILFLTGDPLHYRTLVERVYIGGRLNYERSKSTWFKHIERKKP